MRLSPCVIVLFGATGDLARHKLVPALYAAHRRGTLHPATRIIAIGRKEHTDASIRKEFRVRIPKGASGWDVFARRITYSRLEFHDPAAYDTLAEMVKKLPAQLRDNRLFYLATPQAAFSPIIKHLARTRLGQRKPTKGWHRVVFEKPFGSDLVSAKDLNETVTRLFDEEQVYRIDHYLGKSFVQEILAIRFANPVFDHLWNRNYIENIQIVVCETDGVGTRGGYYDSAGAIRDMIQNHLLQLLALTAMEPPTRVTEHAIRHEKAKVLQAIEPMKGREKVVTGQYRAGRTKTGSVPDYFKEEGIRPGSRTETYAAARLYVHNHRWAGVPFYLRTGKALIHHYAEIAVTFKQGPCVLFGDKNCPTSNVLVIRIQPDEGLKFKFSLTDSTEAYTGVETHWMDFAHETHGFNTPEAYEVLLADAMRGDQTLFTEWTGLKESWRIVDALRRLAPKAPEPYRAGEHGPRSGLMLLKADGRDWLGNQEIHPGGIRK